MQVLIEASDEFVAKQARLLLRSCLAGMDSSVRRVRLEVYEEHDAHGVPLHCCHIQVALRRGYAVAVDEIQYKQVLAISRALERVRRSIHRRGNQRLSAPLA